MTEIMKDTRELIPGYHSMFSGFHGKSIWNYSPWSQNQANSHTTICRQNGYNVQPEFGPTQSQLLAGRLPPHLPTTTLLSSYSTYDDIEKLLENGVEHASKLIGKRYPARSYRNILSQKTCLCGGGVSYCQKVHSLEEILDIFRDEKIRAFYKTANLKHTLTESKFQSKSSPIVREKAEFLCNGHSSECQRNLELYEYTISLLQKYNNLLNNPTCQVRCNFCHQSRSVSIYI